MKKIAKTILCLLLAAVVLLSAAWAVLNFGFGINLLDRSGWKTRGGNTYYQTPKGDPMLGWQEIEGKWYYFDPGREGAMATGWLDTDAGRCYLGSDGVRYTGWLETDAGTFYLHPADGMLHTGWLEVDGEQYFLGSNGVLATGWITQDGIRYYLAPDGSAYTGWLEEDGKRYLLDGKGTIITGWVDTADGRCYLDPTTGAVSTGWVETEEGRYYLDENGHPASGWTDTPQGRCFLNEKGQVATGWVEEDGKRYYLDENGLMITGCLELDGARYYLKENGVMAVGRVEIDGVSRFFTSQGKYVIMTNKWYPIPDDYEVELVSYGKHQISSECVEQLKAMIEQIKPLGYYNVTNVYRSKASQQSIWDKRYNNYRAAGYSHEDAEAEVGKSVAIPGTSEHQLGLAVDIDGVKPVHNWLAEHSWEYGFIVRYPDGKSDITGILYEPWHFRYVGVELAKELYELGLCMEEYMDMLTAQNQD